MGSPCSCHHKKLIVLNKIEDRDGSDYVQYKCSICNSTWWDYE
jgi:hypothetical protein